jgi:hypothetical protein
VTDPTRPPPERELLNSATSRRLLERAAELDAEHRAGSELERLRAAAAEAGISATAFDAALEEMRREAVQPPEPSPSRRSRKRLVSFATAIAIAIPFLLVGALVFRRTVVEPRSTTPELSAQVFTLRCLPAGDAAELIRPLIQDARSAVIVSPGQATRTLRVRTTPEQMERVRALIEQRDAACALPTPPNR